MDLRKLKSFRRRGFRRQEEIFPAVENDQAEREVATVKRPFAPAEVGWQLLRQIAFLKEETKKAEQEKVDLLTRVAKEAFEHRRFLKERKEMFHRAGWEREYRELEILARRLDDLLRGHGIYYEDPTGCVIDEALRPLIDIQTFIPNPYISEERVIKVYYPIVFSKGQLVKRGLVDAEAPVKEVGATLHLIR